MYLTDTILFYFISSYTYRDGFHKIYSKVMIISRQLSPVKCMVDQKELENVEYCNYLDSVITNDERSKQEIKSRIIMAKVSRSVGRRVSRLVSEFNPLNPELNLICFLLALLAHHFLHVSRIRVKSLTLRLLMSYIYIYIYIYDISNLRVN